MSAEVRSARAKVAGLTARGKASEAQIEAARRELQWARITSDIAKWPPLTDEQRAELTRLLWTRSEAA